MNCRTHEHRHFERTLRPWARTKGHPCLRVVFKRGNDICLDHVWPGQAPANPAQRGVIRRPGPRWGLPAGPAQRRALQPGPLKKDGLRRAMARPEQAVLGSRPRGSPPAPPLRAAISPRKQGKDGASAVGSEAAGARQVAGAPSRREGGPARTL